MNDLIITERANITAVADAIRNKIETTSEMTLNEMVNGINNISTTPTLQDKTITPTTSQQTVTADSGYDGLDTVTIKAVTTATQATPNIAVDSSGLITASATQSAGYVAAGTKSATKQLTTKAATTITPSTSNQTIAAKTYLTGALTVKGDANLLPKNIAEGVSMFGVVGTHAGSSGGSGSVETCTVTVTHNRNIYGAYYYKNEDNKIVPTIIGQLSKAYDTDTALGKSITFENVICGTYLTINLVIASYDIGSSFVTEDVTGDIETVAYYGLGYSDYECSHYIIKAPETAGATASISINWES